MLSKIHAFEIGLFISWCGHAYGSAHAEMDEASPVTEDLSIESLLPEDETFYVGSCSITRTSAGNTVGSEGPSSEITVIGYVSIPNYYGGLTKKEVRIPLPIGEESVQWRGEEVRDRLILKPYPDGYSGMRLVNYTENLSWLSSTSTRFILSAHFEPDGTLANLHVRHTVLRWATALPKGPFHIPIDYAFNCTGDPVWRDVFFPSL